LLKRKLDKRGDNFEKGGLTRLMIQHYISETKKVFDELTQETDQYSQRSLSAIKHVCDKNGYQTIYSIAKAVLAIQATSSPIESVFSTAGMCTSDKKANTQSKLLNAKLIVHLNK